MRLLYEWIKCDDNNIIKDCGINLSSDYQIEYDSSNYILTLKKTELSLPNNFYSNENKNVINQITCLVGKNGSGKSSILKHLFKIDNLLVGENYPSWNTIQVFEIDDKLLILHNQSYLRVSTELNNWTVCPVDKSYMGDIFSETTKIFLTNDYFGYINHNFTDKNKQSKIAFTPYDIGVLQSNFFDRILVTNSSYLTHKERFYRINKLFKNKSNPQHFQNILYLILLRNLIDKDIKDKFSYLGNMKVVFPRMAETDSFIDEYGYCKLLINRFTLERILRNDISDDEIDKESNRLAIGKVSKEVLQLCACYAFVKKKSDIKERAAFTNLLINLKTEILFCMLDLDIDIYCLPSLEIEYLLNILNHGIAGINKEVEYGDIIYFNKEIEYQYYKNASKSLIELEKLLNKSNNISQEEILVYKNKELLDFLDEEIKSEDSFILKYIWVSLGCSAGERAFLNLFSWINCIPYLQYFSTNAINGVNKNILLFIDEPDLYCHPEWQRKMIYELINAVETLFDGHNVHLILSTHSPLFLSDIPNDNVVKLDRDENGNIVAELMKERTFGANIFDLYNNSFFLSSFIGEFGQKKIENAIKIVLDAYKNEKQVTHRELCEAGKIIELIGEPILRNKLKNMIKCIQEKR